MNRDDTFNSSAGHQTEASRNETFLKELAGLISNLHTLEFMIRVKLFTVSSKPHNPKSMGFDFADLKVGDEVHENALTDYDPLDRLINRYNREIANYDRTRVIDSSVVRLRDSIAHGRVAFSGTSALGADRFLVKFSKPRAGTCKVVYAECMSNDWLEKQRLFVNAQLEKLIF